MNQSQRTGSQSAFQHRNADIQRREGRYADTGFDSIPILLDTMGNCLSSGDAGGASVSFALDFVACLGVLNFSDRMNRSAVEPVPNGLIYVLCV
jgi:hypothetical protein